MKYILAAIVLTCFLLGNWQIYRFYYKRNISQKLENCLTTELPTASNLRKNIYCEFRNNGVLQTEKIFFLFKSINESYVITPLKIASNYLLINLGYIDNNNKLDILKEIKQVNELNFTSIILMADRKKILINNDWKNSQLYHLNIDDMRKYTALPIHEHILYSISNDITRNNLGAIIPNKKPSIRKYMHIGYAVMWYLISMIGLVIWIINLRIEEKT